MVLFLSKVFRYSFLYLTAIVFVTTADAVVFTDDLGVEHEFPDDRPANIVVSSYSALALRHFGLEAEQLAATYHSRGVTGSNSAAFDPTDFNEAEFPGNPSPEEEIFLSEVEDLSRACSPIRTCTSMNMEVFRSVAPNVDFVIMEGYRHEVSLFGDYVQEIEEVMGKPIILIDVSLAGTDCRPDAANRCYGKSFIEVVKQMEELALFLKYTPPPTLEEDKEDLCQAAQEFQEIALGAHERGVRVMAAYLAYQGLLQPNLPADYTNYFATPQDDSVLRMLEELGMPLLHPWCENPNEDELCPFDEYYWETVHTDTYFGECNSIEPADLAICANENSPLYPVDMWLYDHRGTQWAMNPAFAEVFPDKAVEAGQLAFWPIGGHSLSYHFAAEILKEVGPTLDRAQRIHPATDCIEADVAGEAHRTVGLPRGSYACYDAQYHNEDYLTCPTDPPSLSPTRSPVQETQPPVQETQSPVRESSGESSGESSSIVSSEATTNDDGGLGAGAIAGIVVGIVIVAAVVVLFLYTKSQNSGTDFDTMNPSIQKMRDAEQGQGDAPSTNASEDIPSSSVSEPNFVPTES